MKNYYELLEVNENASQEVIEKAYRVLAKKYHPDVQPRDKIFWAEAEFKKISEAYSVLSDPEKRIIYDFEHGLANQDINYKEKYNSLYSEQEQLKQELHFLKNKQVDKGNQNDINNNQKFFGMFNLKSFVQSISQAIYNQTQKSKEERSRDLQALILTAIIMAILLFIFWKVPFIRNFLFP